MENFRTRFSFCLSLASNFRLEFVGCLQKLIKVAVSCDTCSSSTNPLQRSFLKKKTIKKNNFLKLKSMLKKIPQTWHLALAVCGFQSKTWILQNCAVPEVDDTCFVSGPGFFYLSLASNFRLEFVGCLQKLIKVAVSCDTCSSSTNPLQRSFLKKKTIKKNNCLKLKSMLKNTTNVTPGVSGLRFPVENVDLTKLRGTRSRWHLFRFRSLLYIAYF